MHMIGLAVRGGYAVLRDVLRTHREAQGWTQEEVAARATVFRGKDVEQTDVSYWERVGIKRPTGAQLRMLSYAYQLPVLHLAVAAGYLRDEDMGTVSNRQLLPASPPGSYPLPDDPPALLRLIANATHRLEVLMSGAEGDQTRPESDVEPA